MKFKFVIGGRNRCFFFFYNFHINVSTMSMFAVGIIACVFSVLVAVFPISVLFCLYIDITFCFIFNLFAYYFQLLINILDYLAT